MSRLKRIAFARAPGYTRYPYHGALSLCDGMPISASQNLSQLLEQYAYTGNKGNLIHGEAPARMFACDRNNSCYLNLVSLAELGWSPEQISEEIADRFDMLVFSMANAIRPEFDPEVLTDIVETLRTPFMVLGPGVGERLPETLESLHPNLVRLLRIVNSRATIFGVRGMETEKWLRSWGFCNALALDCPSMYVYPTNIMRLRGLSVDKARVASTAGYIHQGNARSSAILSLFRNFPAHYVMQTELNALRTRLPKTSPIYNDASGEVDLETMRKALSGIHSESIPFLSFRWFHDPGVWRLFQTSTDFYLGDRIHCGLVALQAGVHAIVIEDDLRVQELTDFMQIPVISVQEAEDAEPLELVSELLNEVTMDRMKVAFKQRFQRFEDILTQAGIPLTVKLNN